MDNHAASFHTTNPDLPSAGDELELAIKYIRMLKGIFPVMDILESNHGSLYYRKAIASSIPSKAIKTYMEVLDAPKEWSWHKDLIISLPSGQKCLFQHQIGSNPLIASKERECSIVQGHYHSKLEAIGYVTNNHSFRFGITAGCLIDDKSMAFAYNKTQTKRPKLGAVIIKNGSPIIIPMILNYKNQWIKELL